MSCGLGHRGQHFCSMYHRMGVLGVDIKPIIQITTHTCGTIALGNAVYLRIEKLKPWVITVPIRDFRQKHY